jgi:hypothetical protein
MYRVGKQGMFRGLAHRTKTFGYQFRMKLLGFSIMLCWLNKMQVFFYRDPKMMQPQCITDGWDQDISQTNPRHDPEYDIDFVLK